MRSNFNIVNCYCNYFISLWLFFTFALFAKSWRPSGMARQSSQFQIARSRNCRPRQHHNHAKPETEWNGLGMSTKWTTVESQSNTFLENSQLRPRGWSKLRFRDVCRDTTIKMSPRQGKGESLTELHGGQPFARDKPGKRRRRRERTSESTPAQETFVCRHCSRSTLLF